MLCDFDTVFWLSKRFLQKVIIENSTQSSEKLQYLNISDILQPPNESVKGENNQMPAEMNC